MMIKALPPELPSHDAYKQDGWKIHVRKISPFLYSSSIAAETAITPNKLPPTLPAVPLNSVGED